MIWLVDNVLNCLKLVTLPMFFSWAFTYAIFLWMYIVAFTGISLFYFPTLTNVLLLN